MWNSDLPSLTLGVPAIRGANVIGEFDFWVVEYRHVTVRDGGYYEASWRMPLDRRTRRELAEATPDRAVPGVGVGGNEGMLRTWFETPYLMHHVEERATGTITWEGVVWEMELTLDGLTRRVTMDEVWNAVRADYTDMAGNLQITSWYTAEDSIAVYGRRELILDERYVSAAEAEEAAQSFLAEHAWPEPEVVEIATTRAPGLFVKAIGYGATANFQYVNTDAADGQTGNISEFVSRILAYNCEFVRAGNIVTNTLQRYRRFDRLIRGWDAIMELVRMGDAGGRPWVATVTNGRRLNYESADNTPILFWRGEERGVEQGVGMANAWTVRPGVMRDLTGIISTSRPGAFLHDARDTFVNEVEMSQGREKPVFKPGGYDPLAIIRARDQYLDWMESMEDA